MLQVRCPPNASVPLVCILLITLPSGTKYFVKGPKNPATSILTYENQWPRTALLKSDRSQSGWSKTGGRTGRTKGTNQVNHEVYVPSFFKGHHVL